MSSPGIFKDEDNLPFSAGKTSLTKTSGCIASVFSSWDSLLLHAHNKMDVAMNRNVFLIADNLIKCRFIKIQLNN